MARFRDKSEATEGRTNPPTDIAAVLAVIVRRDQESLQRESENNWKLDFREANLSGANLSRTDLAGANLTGADLSSTTRDAETRLPEGTPHPAHWPAEEP